MEDHKLKYEGYQDEQKKEFLEEKLFLASNILDKKTKIR
jgi:hypothetical protein